MFRCPLVRVSAVPSAQCWRGGNRWIIPESSTEAEPGNGLQTDTMSLALIAMIALVVVAVTSAVHGTVGFGMNLLAVPVLVVLDPALVPGPAVAAGIVLSALVLARERATVDKRLGWAMVGLLPGTMVALLLLSLIPTSELALAMGLLVLVAVGISATHVKMTPTPLTLFIAGVASGFLATAGSIGGPPMALVYAHSSGTRVRTNLSGFFVITGVTSLVALTLTGHFAIREAQLTALLLPGVLLGYAASGRLRPWADSGYTRSAVLLLSALAGIAAIADGLLR
jgi:uncharacterized membrane protein YfcA